MDKNQQAVAIFNKLASHYQEKFMNVDLYSDTFDRFCKELKSENAEILEIACGPGNITRHILDKHPGLKFTSTDLAPNMVELGRLNNPEANFMVLDAREIKSLNRIFDGIVCGFCLPYFSKEETEKFIADAYDILSPSGVLYLSAIEDDYSKSGWRKGSTGDEIFMHYYSAALLEQLLVAAGFEILEMKRKIYPGPDGSDVTDVIFIAKK